MIALHPVITWIADRARIAVALAKVTAACGGHMHPMRRALWTTLLARVVPEERDWIARIERRREELLADQALIGPPFDPTTPKTGHGEASRRDKAPVSVASQMMSLPPLWCLLLMRLIRELAPRSCLELGTGFGISTAYQAAALQLNGSGSLTTLEGSSGWAQRARASLSALGLDGVRLRVGPIADSLPSEAAAAAPLDFVFIDAEHQAEATLTYFEGILPSLAAGAVVVIDDVNWPEMKRAQTEIGHAPQVGACIKVGRVGLTVIAAT